MTRGGGVIFRISYICVILTVVPVLGRDLPAACSLKDLNAYLFVPDKYCGKM